MPRPDRRHARRSSSSGTLVAILTGLLIAFAVWCVVLLTRTHELRSALDSHLGWLEDARRIRSDLEQLQRGGRATGGTPESDPQLLLERAGRALQGIARGAGDAEAQVTARDLQRALDDLRTRLAGDPDDLWDSSAAALAATRPLEAQLQDLIARLLEQLARLWTSLYALALASLILAGSNLILLQVAFRRRQELEASQQKLEEQGSHDPLTGLWNRAAILKLLREELARAVRTGVPLAVILADLDEFHQVNNLLGHDQGDFVLEQLAHSLGSMVRPYDTLGRLGGDSFLVVLPACEIADTINVAERLRAACEREVDHGLGRIGVTASLVYAVVDEPGQVDTDLLLHRLEERLRQTRAEHGPSRVAALKG